MAVSSILSKSALTLRYKEGIDASGNDIIKAKKFSNIKVTSAAQDIYDVAAAFTPLMKYAVAEVLRTDDSTIING